MKAEILTVESLGLSEADMNEIVLGAQRFVAPELDPRDDEKFFPPKDTVDVPLKRRTS